jgi:hypothetical protein
MNISTHLCTPGLDPLFNIQKLRKDITYGHWVINRTRRHPISQGVVLTVQACKQISIEFIWA